MAEQADLKVGMPSALLVADTDATIQGMLARIRQLEDFIRRKNLRKTVLPEIPRKALSKPTLRFSNCYTKHYS